MRRKWQSLKLFSTVQSWILRSNCIFQTDNREKIDLNWKVIFRCHETRWTLGCRIFSKRYDWELSDGNNLVQVCVCVCVSSAKLSKSISRSLASLFVTGFVVLLSLLVVRFLIFSLLASLLSSCKCVKSFTGLIGSSFAKWTRPVYQTKTNVNVM